MLLAFTPPGGSIAAVIVVEEDRDPNDGWYVPPHELDIQTRSPTYLVNNSQPTGTGTNVLTQTFTMTNNLLLTHIEFAYRTTGPGVYNLAIRQVSNPTSATLSVINTLFSGLQFSIAADSTDYTVAGSTITYSLLALQLSGANAVMLNAGSYYAVDLSRVSGSQLSLIRNGQNNYLDGAAFVNDSRAGPLGGQDRDFTMSLSSYIIPEPTSVMLVFLGAAMVFRGRGWRTRSGRRPPPDAV